ncbi:hypothetical protein OESDEN_09062 [Oesophagostomum dentatum]|uniref:Uncharacterized protein n=1 Tax=Oesophagostomum dentatum TaxID=61180 RepID=A0A0B1T1G3_OESDE|nr:hypothetical protein OESDEN_09062 [Oesophagostomum dentatum]
MPRFVRELRRKKLRRKRGAGAARTRSKTGCKEHSASTMMCCCKTNGCNMDPISTEGPTSTHTTSSFSSVSSVSSSPEPSSIFSSESTISPSSEPGASPSEPAISASSKPSSSLSPESSTLSFPSNSTVFSLTTSKSPPLETTTPKTGSRNGVFGIFSLSLLYLINQLH